jgi:hypothetical protein
MGVFPDSGLIDALAALLSGYGPLTLRLAKNNVTITRATVLTDFTEANYSGYAPQTLGTFATPALDSVNHRSYAAAPALSFQNTTGSVGNSIYAVYATNGAGHLVYAEEVAGGPSVPVDMTTAGKTFVYTPTFYQYSQASTSP